MKIFFRNLLVFMSLIYNLWAESKCHPAHLSELDIAKSVIEYSLSGGGNYYMQDKNICLKQDNFPYIAIHEIERGEITEGNPEYFVQSKHNFTITSVKKIKRDLGFDYYQVVFIVDTIKEKKKVKLNMVIDYTIDLNRSDFGDGCLLELYSNYLGVVYQECYDSVKSQHDQEEEKER